MRIVLMLGAALALTACGGGRIADRERPDEFAVARTAPLVIPPDFTLAPPRPGAPRPVAETSQQQALEALFGAGVQLPPKSPTELSMLDAARVNRVTPTIRSDAGDPATVGVDKGAFLRELLDAPAQTRNPQVARVDVQAPR